MAVGANSYGEASGVAVLVPKWTNSGSFDGTTLPTITTVESQIDRISAFLNACLADEGFTIPVSQADVVMVLTEFVESEVASIVEGIHGSGRFGPTARSRKGSGGSRFHLIMREARDFISENTAGFERLGATRSYSDMANLDYRNVDESGRDTFPIFQRSGFGNSFEDWDNG